MNIYPFLINEFYTKYKTNDTPLRIFFAPGRVNIIGEHIDYNGGPVMPAGISMGIYVIARLRSDNEIHLKSSLHKKEIILKTEDTFTFYNYDGWTNYPKGVFQFLKNAGYKIGGVDLLVYSDLPGGAGLSSSAAVELAFAYTMMQLFNSDKTMPLEKLAVLCQQVENKFVGVNCGIMDQFASAMAKKDHAIVLQCDTLAYEYIPMNLREYSLVIMNTNKQRSLAGSEFNKRREECELALQIINEAHQYKYLCDADLEDIDIIKDELIKKRAKHVISEKQSVLATKKYFEQGDLVKVGEQLNESHQSLKVDFEVSCIELDTIVDLAQNHPACIGSRMTGAGFGGCAIALVATHQYPNFKLEISEKYKLTTNLEPSFYKCAISDGAHEIKY